MRYFTIVPNFGLIPYVQEGIDPQGVPDKIQEVCGKFKKILGSLNKVGWFAHDLITKYDCVSLRLFWKNNRSDSYVMNKIYILFI